MDKKAFATLAMLLLTVAGAVGQGDDLQLAKACFLDRLVDLLLRSGNICRSVEPVE